jgi:phenylalanyl-tRNA synthetase beta chain
MKFTLSWLKEHLDTTATATEIAERLTALGLEVESLQDRGATLAPFVIAKIISAEQHPDADRLRVCVVQTGTAEVKVVCGAPNARAGLVGVFAPVGSVIPASGVTLKKGLIRGAESNGMMCSAAELQTAEESDGIIELPPDAPIGQPYAVYAQLNDPLFELKLTPNRPDCAGVLGIARDLAAAGLGTLRPLALQPVAATKPCPIRVILTTPACPHFIGRHITGLRNGDSPPWLQRQLRAIGLRPISALVDITNYICFAAARPLHVFDAATLQGDITVRLAQAGETLAALNDKTYVLPPEALVIADASGVLALAGIIGGMASGCTAATTEVFLEAAFFAPKFIARTGRQLQINSDARYRFEREIDPAFTAIGAEWATQLIVELCGTADTAVSEVVVAGAAPVAANTQQLRLSRCASLIGVDIAAAEQSRILTALGFAPQQQGDGLQVTVPSWRPDIHGEADLVEEIIRVHGFAAIPAVSLTPPATMATAGLTVPQRRLGFARRALALQGLLETVTWAFMPAAMAAQFQPRVTNPVGTDPAMAEANAALRLRNPIAAELDHMRPSILGNLLQAAARNTARGFADHGLFEIGAVYQGVAPEDQKTVATVLRAGVTPRHWSGKARVVDVYDVKADAQAALAACGVNVAALQITADAPAYYHPGQSGCLRQGNVIVASFGMLHPALLQQYGLKQAVAGAEIWLGVLPVPKATGSAKPALLLPPLQAVTRDFAFVVDTATPADKLLKAIRQVDKALIVDVELFDVYAGAALGQGKKSLALTVTLQPKNQSLTDAELEQVSAAIISAAGKAVGGVLRAA